VPFPTPFRCGELNPAIAKLHGRFVCGTACEAPAGAAGRLSMGIGSVNACVISRPLVGWQTVLFGSPKTGGPW